MYPELLPHPRHARAIELMQNAEAGQLRRHGSYAVSLRGHWKYTDDQIKQWLLVLCNQTTRLPDADFERAVWQTLEACTQFPVLIPEPDQHAFQPLPNIYSPDGDIL